MLAEICKLKATSGFTAATAIFMHDRRVRLLRPVSRVRDFIEGKRSCVYAQATWLAFHVRSQVAGFVVWGTPAGRDFDSMRELIVVADSPLAQRMARFIDLRRLDGIDHAAFAAFARHFADYAVRFADIISRAAVVHAGGLGLGLASGFSSLVPTQYEVGLFPEPVAALTWLGCNSCAQLAAELESAQASSVGLTPIVRDLRAFCAANLHGARLSTAAAVLGVSARTLQRKLRDEATTFQHELVATRIEAAKRLLVDTGDSVGEIASAVGCSSAQHLGSLFRTATGETPSRWRAMRAMSAKGRRAQSASR
jgi:AraC-like DNA-binding protein